MTPQCPGKEIIQELHSRAMVGGTQLISAVPVFWAISFWSLMSLSIPLSWALTAVYFVLFHQRPLELEGTLPQVPEQSVAKNPKSQGYWLNTFLLLFYIFPTMASLGLDIGRDTSRRALVLELRMASTGGRGKKTLSCLLAPWQQPGTARSPVFFLRSIKSWSPSLTSLCYL